jgi:cytochrome c oxidase assembly protein subunit 15
MSAIDSDAATHRDLTQRRRLLRWLALLGAAVVLLVTATSAFLRVSAAGLGCENWPACYGQTATAGADAAAKRPSLARLVHRISASAAGAAVLGIGLIAVSQPRRFKAELLVAAVLMLITVGLATLGRATPGATVPVVAMGNVLGGMLMASLLWWLALGERGRAEPRARGLAPLSWLALLATFAQIGLGVLTSASYSGLACTSLPSCTEAGFPGAWSASDLDPWRAAAGSPSIHMAHRVGTLVVAALVVRLAWLIGAQGPRGRRLRAALLLALSVQALLGVLLVRFGLPLPVAVAHNSGAALLLLTLVAAHHGAGRTEQQV